MRFETFIAKRFLPKDRNTYTGPLVSIATYSIALAVLVMVSAVCILRGFQGEIRQKVVGFGSHIVVQSYAMGNTYESSPIDAKRPEVKLIGITEGVKKIQFFATKGGMVKTDDQIQGIILKGVSFGYDSTFFAGNRQEGRLFRLQQDSISNEVIISKSIADKLQVGVGDKLRTYFWQDNNYRARAFSICGIYQTDLNDFDQHYIIGDIAQVQRLNGWDSNLVAGYEVLVDDFSTIDAVVDRILPILGYDLTLTTIVDQYPALFSWLDLLDSNIILIIAIMVLVCIVSIVSALLIMIFEKTSTIGMLMAMGCDRRSIRRIFLLKSAGIIGKGVLLGDAAALLLCGLQKEFRLIHLDSTSYSMDAVPIALDGWTFIYISLGTIVVCLAALLLPITHTTRIEPAKSIRVS